MKKIKLLLLLTGISFSMMAQKSVTIYPDYGKKKETLMVSITGTNTNFLSGSNTIQFYRQGSPTFFVQASPTLLLGPTQLVAKVFISASATLGDYTYSLFNPTDGKVNGSTVFKVIADTLAPALASINPNVGGIGQSLTVTITGIRTQFKNGTPTVFFTKGTSTLPIYAYQLNNDSVMKVEIGIPSNAERGYYDVSVNTEGTHFLTLPEAFEVTWPIGIENKEVSHAVRIYPIPAREQVTIEAETEKIEHVEVRNILGQIVYEHPMEQPESRVTIPLEAILPAHNFLLIKVRAGNGELWYNLLRN